MGVQGGVLFGKLIMDSTVGGAVKVVDVWLVYGWAGKAHERACAKGDCGKMGRGELEMCFHGAVLVASTDGAKLELELVISDHVGFCVGILGLGLDGRRRWRRCRCRCKLLLPGP